EFNRNLIHTLARTAEILEAEDSWMRSIAEDWLNRNGTNREDGFVISVELLESAPVALVRRLLRGALQKAGSDLRDVSFDHIESVRSLLKTGKSGKVIE